VSVCWSQLWAIQKRLNQSRCRLVCGNGWAQGIRIRWGEPTLQGKGHFLKEHVGLQYSSVAGVVLLSFYFWSSVSLQIEMYVLLPICFIILGLLFLLFTTYFCLTTRSGLFVPYAQTRAYGTFWAMWIKLNICVNVGCRLRGRKSRDIGYSGDDLLTSLDVKSATHHSVVVGWRHRQAAVMSSMLYFWCSFDI